MTAPGVYTPHQGQDKPRQGTKQVVVLPEAGSEAERALVEWIARSMWTDRYNKKGGPRDWTFDKDLASVRVFFRDLALAALREIAKDAVA